MFIGPSINDACQSARCMLERWTFYWHVARCLGLVFGRVHCCHVNVNPGLIDHGLWIRGGYSPKVITRRTRPIKPPFGAYLSRFHVDMARLLGQEDTNIWDWFRWEFWGGENKWRYSSNLLATVLGFDKMSIASFVTIWLFNIAMENPQF